MAATSWMFAVLASAKVRQPVADVEHLVAVDKTGKVDERGREFPTLASPSDCPVASCTLKLEVNEAS